MSFSHCPWLKMWQCTFLKTSPLWCHKEHLARTRASLCTYTRLVMGVFHHLSALCSSFCSFLKVTHKFLQCPFASAAVFVCFWLVPSTLRTSAPPHWTDSVWKFCFVLGTYRPTGEGLILQQIKRVNNNKINSTNAHIAWQVIRNPTREIQSTFYAVALELAYNFLVIS